MLNTIIVLVFLLFYLSLFVELYYYSVPSVVATKKIFYPEISSTDYFSKHIRRIFKWPFFKKVVIFIFPMIFIYVLHILPAFFLFKLGPNRINLENICVLTYLGLGLVIMGRVISHLYLIKIDKIKTYTFEGFVTNGVFKISRNPGLMGLYISFLGFFMIVPSKLFLLCFVIYIVHMHFKIKMEEDFLTNKHGESYEKYLQKTRRYL